MPSQDSTEQFCSICQLIANRKYIELHEHGVLFVPDNAIKPGHIIVAPRIHIRNALMNPVITAQVFRLVAMRAAVLAPVCTITTTVGSEAARMIPHMYVHIIPSTDNEIEEDRKKRIDESRAREIEG
jgi:diadenosine tetraphosphate (Ap4A) HIT family hydrolase